MLSLFICNNVICKAAYVPIHWLEPGFVSILQLYSSAISEHPIEEIPTYWHKNYALVCQRLLSLQHDQSVPELLDKAISHYERFIKLDPADEDYDAIVKAIKQLKAQRKNSVK